jgi:glutamate racemase
VSDRTLPTARAPLGVFDSGLGGLTVVRAVSTLLPAESMVYFGDTARLPYGNKSQGTVTRLSLEALRFLEHHGIKALVVACNSASALALDALQAEAQVPVLGVVHAGARRAAETTRSGRVGGIGTHATVASGCYGRELERIRSGFTVTSAACPLFVPLVEEGWIDHAVTREIAEEYLGPLRRASVDTLILGCTHYPLLRPVIQEVMGAEVVLIDSGEAVARELEETLDRLGLRAGPGEASHRFFVSDQKERFGGEARRFLGASAPGRVEAVDQSDIPWYDRSSVIGPDPTRRTPDVSS